MILFMTSKCTIKQFNHENCCLAPLAVAIIAQTLSMVLTAVSDSLLFALAQTEA